MFVVASPVDADAPLASARDTTAIPNVGKASLFEERFDIAQLSRPFGHSSNRPLPAANRGRRLRRLSPVTCYAALSELCRAARSTSKTRR